jgi:FlaA1/EpsC-like NDP-sugar epimerase
VSKVLPFRRDADPFDARLHRVVETSQAAARSLWQQLIGQRRPVIIGTQIVLLAVASYVAFWLRFDGSIPDGADRAFLLGLPIVIVVRGLFLHRLRLFGGLWRYTGTWDLRNLVLASGLASAALLVLMPLLVPSYPRAVLVIDGILAIFFLGGLRLSGRAYHESASRRGARRVLIFGAGDAGEMVTRELRHNPEHGMWPVGFVDDDPWKRGCYVHGVPVLGSRHDLAAIVAHAQPHEILIAIPQLPSDALRTLLTELTPLGLPLKILPTFEAMLDRRGSLVSRARPLAIEDLLRREPVALDPTVVRAVIQGRRVLVTGAGGSIGSELCRQVAAFRPASLVMLDRYENGLFATEHTLLRESPNVERHQVIADITDRPRMERIFAAYRPEIVFHAAAHKHVPLMELNPSEAIKNNVGGTRTVAEVALAHGASRFILISTDKAVNPSSIMGATKRVAELVTQTLARRSTGTVFAAVRFGNVLGSNGSVVPLFMEQIEKGGPVTVTHPDMRRFFMLIPEAVQLVLNAASVARQGETYILDMGEQVKVADVAQDLIRLSAQRRTDGEIRIEFIGPRPGEKLYEELVGDDEVLESSDQDRISRVRPLVVRDGAVVEHLVSRMLAAAGSSSDEIVVELMKQLVPTFRSVVAPELPTAAVPSQGARAREADAAPRLSLVQRGESAA